MNTLHILKIALSNLKEFSKGDITEESFNKAIAELKAILYQLRSEITREEQKTQLDEIIYFRVVSQHSNIEQLFIQFFDRKRGHTWNKKGKFIHDLDHLELKLGGLIYKIEHENSYYRLK